MIESASYIQGSSTIKGNEERKYDRMQGWIQDFEIEHINCCSRSSFLPNELQYRILFLPKVLINTTRLVKSWCF